MVQSRALSEHDGIILTIGQSRKGKRIICGYLLDAIFTCENPVFEGRFIPIGRITGQMKIYG